MHEPVPNSRFADYPVLWIVDVKSTIWAMAISLMGELCMQSKNIVFQITLKFQNIKF